MWPALTAGQYTPRGINAQVATRSRTWPDDIPRFWELEPPEQGFDENLSIIDTADLPLGSGWLASARDGLVMAPERPPNCRIGAQGHRPRTVVKIGIWSQTAQPLGFHLRATGVFSGRSPAAPLRRSNRRLRRSTSVDTPQHNRQALGRVFPCRALA